MTLMRDTTAFGDALCGLQHFAQHAIDAEAHDEAALERFDVDVGRAFLDRFGQQRVDQADDRRVVSDSARSVGFRQLVGERLRSSRSSRSATIARASSPCSYSERSSRS
jgi:hypothetical protein